MTSPLRRNRRTTTPQAWIRISALGLGLWCAVPLLAQDAAPPVAEYEPINLPEPRTLPPVDEPIPAAPLAEEPVVAPAASEQGESLTSEPTPAQLAPVEPKHGDHEIKSFREEHEHLVHEVLKAKPGSDGDIRNAESSLIAAQASDYDDERSTVDTSPPSRERLFRVLTQQEYLQTLEAKFRARNERTTGPFFLPAPVDLFDGPETPTLSRLWYQNRETGINVDPFDGQRGNMGTKGGEAVVPVGSEPEVAIISEPVGSPNMQVTLKITLGSAGSTFGLVLRALDPTGFEGNVDQIKVNRYFYVLFGESSVAIYHHEPGKEDVLIKSADIPPKLSFQAMASVAGDQFQVTRDGVPVLTAIDTTVADDKERHEYTGMISGITEESMTRVDNFIAQRFGGYFSEREFSPSTALFRGPNVHYHPLYFEQVALERYGQHLGNLVAPVVAHGMFFADAAMLPYSLGKSPPWTCQNDVCLYKPGDIVPFRIYCPVKDPKGAILQATAMALAYSLIP